MMEYITTELWDNMHYLFRDFNDRMVHVALEYPYQIDAEKFKTVLLCFLEKAPVLHASFQDNGFKTYWKVEPYHMDEVLTVAYPNDIEKAEEKFLLQTILPQEHLQLKAALLYHENKTTLCLLVNHMCMDGGDLKYFLYTLAQEYSAYVEEGKSPIGLRVGDRSFETVYENFSPEDQKAAKHLYKNVCSKDRHAFPLTEPHKTDTAFMVRRKIDAKTFLKLKAVGKAQGATVNDVFTTAYLDSLYTLLNLPKDEPLSVSCAMDLRRYKATTEQDGLTNHTAFMQCPISKQHASILEMLSEVQEKTKEAKSQKFTGLYGLPLLKACYQYLPHAMGETLIKIGYRNPLLSMSNIGVLDAQKLALCGVEPCDGYMTGAVKYKPFVLLSVTTMHNVATFSMCCKGNEADKKTVENFMDLLEESLQKFLA